MKTYFAKYLPVEGEIKEGDYFIRSKCNTIMHAGDISITEKANLLKYPKAKLFLCSRDIQVGDRVWNQDSGYGEVKEIDIEGETLGVKYDLQDYEVEEDFKYIVKVIGEISPEAKWVKEGDEFDEGEVFNSPAPLWITGIGYQDFIQVKCPCCETFK
jgi:hypothetical protein